MKPPAEDSSSDRAPAAAPSRGHVTEARGRKAVLGLGWSALNTGSAVFISLVVFIVSSRILDPQDFGIVALAMSIITFIGCATPGGFGEAIVQRADIDDAHLDTVFWLCVGTGLLAFLPILLFSGALAEWMEEPVLAVLLPFFGVKLLLDLAAVVPQALVVRAMQFKHVAARTAIGNSIGGLVCIIMALNGYGLWALAAAPMIASVATIVILAYTARWRPGFRIRMQSLRDLLRFGLFSSGANALHFLNADRLVLGLLVGPATLGLYYLGKRLFDLLTGLISGALWPVTTVFFASVQKETGTHIRAFQNVLRTASLVAFPIFGGLYMVADTAVPMILGNHWEPALPAVKAFAIIGLFSGLIVPSAALANGLGRSDLNFAVDALRNILAVVAILLSVKDGLETIATFVLMAHAIMLPASFLIARKLTGISLGLYVESLSVPVIASLGMIATITAIPWLFPGGTEWKILFAQIGLAAVVYCMTVLMLSGREIAELRRALSKEPAHG